MKLSTKVKNKGIGYWEGVVRYNNIDIRNVRFNSISTLMKRCEEVESITKKMPFTIYVGKDEKITLNNTTFKHSDLNNSETYFNGEVFYQPTFPEEFLLNKLISVKYRKNTTFNLNIIERILKIFKNFNFHFFLYILICNVLIKLSFKSTYLKNQYIPKGILHSRKLLNSRSGFIPLRRRKKM